MDKFTKGASIKMVEELDNMIEQLVDIRKLLSDYPDMKARIVSAYCALGEVRDMLFKI